MLSLVIKYAVPISYAISIAITALLYKLFRSAVNTGRIRAYFSTLGERRIYEGHGEPFALSKPHIFDHQLAIVAFLILGSNISSIVNRTALAFVVIGLPVVLLPSAFAIHFRPNIQRWIKFDLAITGFSLILFVHIIHYEHSLFNVATIILLCLVIFQAATARTIRSWVIPHDKRQPSWALVILRAVRRAGPVVLAVFILTHISFLTSAKWVDGSRPILIATEVVMIIYLMVRYEIVARFVNTPILFFRSFHHKATGSVYGNLIAEATAKHGVVVSLVHSEQKASDLLKSCVTDNQPALFTAEGAEWQEWVKRSLEHASLVLIDVSVYTKSVAWELNTAKEVIGESERLILLADRNSDICRDDFRGCSIVQYDMDNASSPGVRSELEHLVGEALGVAGRGITIKVRL